jgi:hypothetical protein
MQLNLRVLTCVWTLASGSAWASCHPNCPFVPPEGGLAFQTPGAFITASQFRPTDKFVLGAGLGYAFPNEPLKPDQWYVKLVPGVWSSSAQPQDYLVGAEFRGYVLAGSLVYGINKNWGVTFTGVWEQSNDGSADEVVTVIQRRAARHVAINDGETDGYIVALGAIWDPVAGERFRLPIAFGIGYNYYSATIEGPFEVQTPTRIRSFRYHGNHSVERASLFFGLAPQFDYRDFRFIPFIVTSDSAFFDGKGTATVRIQGPTAGAVREAQLTYSEVTYLSGGISVKYVPWNLGVSLLRGDLKDRGIDTNVFSLSWEKKW